MIYFSVHRIVAPSSESELFVIVTGSTDFALSHHALVTWAQAYTAIRHVIVFLSHFIIYKYITCLKKVSHLQSVKIYYILLRILRTFALCT